MDYHCIANIPASVERAGYYMCIETIKRLPEVQPTIEKGAVSIEISYVDLLPAISHSIIVPSWKYTIYTHHA